MERGATRVIILHKARVVADGSVDDLRHMSTLPSLEQIFTQLVEHQDSEQVAREIIEVISR